MAGKLTYSVIPVWQVALMVKGTGSAYEVVCAIKDTPDLMSAPEQLETTALSDSSRTFMEGLAGDNGALDFTINYDVDDIENLISLQGAEKDFAVYFGGTVDGTTGVFTPTGENGIYKGKGTLSFTVSGRSVNGVPEAVIHITRTGVWSFEIPA